MKTGHMFTLHKGGGEKTVKLETLAIPDLWHIAGAQDTIDREKILEAWHMAHQLKKALIDALAQRDELREACQGMVDAYGQCECVESSGVANHCPWCIARAALAKCEPQGGTDGQT